LKRFHHELTMSPLAASVVVFLCVFGGALLGMLVSPLLPVQHQSSDSKDIVRLGMGLVATTVAVALGLLIASAKNFYDTQCAEMTQLAANYVVLDRVLTHYGPETSDARAAERAVLANHRTGAALDQVQAFCPRSGNCPTHANRGLEWATVAK
jgi:hypothetical protein